jgi:SAM-dependent methyltransferase
MPSSAELRFRQRLANPDHELLASIRRETWTSHNIPLTNDDSTLGTKVSLIADDMRTKVIKSLVRRLTHAGSELRILDLGSLEGGLSLEMAREGWNTTGVEGRRTNFEKAELIRRYFDLSNLSFRLQDVKAIDPEEGRFDAILCCGLLYHVDEPFDLLERLAALTTDDGLLFVDTHVAPEPDQQFALYEGQLSEQTTLTRNGKTYEGRWFAEPSGGTVLDEQWSAVSNARSFWPTRRSLIRGLYHAGFHAVHELFGMFDIDGEFELRERYSRLYLLCTKQW